MIAIDNILVSDKLIEEEFICDLNKCKGACCEDGDAGAPLEKEEMDLLNGSFAIIEPYLTVEGREEIERQGRYIYDQEFGWVTPTVGGGICAYGIRDRKGVIKCGIEQAWTDGKLSWKKPISCHLYPVRISANKKQGIEYVNYEPRESTCRPACALGKHRRTPVFRFLKEALIRKYGPDFYEALEAATQRTTQEQ
jgi:hypothetical protein